MKQIILLALFFISSSVSSFSQSSAWDKGSSDPGQSVYEFSNKPNKGATNMVIGGGDDYSSGSNSSGGHYNSDSNPGSASINSFSGNAKKGKTKDGEESYSDEVEFLSQSPEESSSTLGALQEGSSIQRSSSWLPDPENGDATSEGEYSPIDGSVLQVFFLLAAVYVGFTTFRFRREPNTKK